MTWRDDERELLELAREIEPEAARNRTRLLASFSMASAVALAAASVKAAVTLEASLALTAAEAASLSALAKATVIGGAVGAAAGIAADRLEGPTVDPPPIAPQTSVVSAMPASHQDAVSTGQTPVVAEESMKGEAEPSTMPAPSGRNTQASARAEQPRPAPHPAPSSPASETASSAGDEPVDTERAGATRREAIAALDRARGALAARDFRAAQGALDAYDAHRGDGRLDPEAALLRLRTLQAAGHCRQAAALAQQWLAQQPTTAYGAALRALISECR